MSCKYLHKVTDITVTAGTSVTLGFDTLVTVVNTERVCIKICKAVPESGYNLPVLATVNGATVPVWNKYGNPMTGDELSKCKLYKGYYGANTPHIILTNEPGCNGC